MIGFPFDSHVTYDEEGNPNFDRAISSAPYRKLLKELFTTGIMPTKSDNLQVAAGNGMSVIVRPGFAMVEGCMKLEEEVITLPLQASDSALDRIDTVVLRLDSNEAVRSCELAIVQGAGSLVPTRPELTRNESIYEIGLADILVSKNVSVISDSKITDTRYENERCGVVSSVSEFDTTTLDQQMNAWSNEQRASFEAWVESIKDILDESTAGHLQSEIDELKVSAGGAKDLVSDAFDSTRTYAAGEYCIYNNKLWKSKSANNRGNTPAENSYWTMTNLGSDVTGLNDSLNEIKKSNPSGRIDLLTYGTNYYYAPSDGYVFLYNTSSQGSVVFVGLTSDSINFGGVPGRFCVFVRKGAAIKKDGIAAVYAFVPLT